jgi:GNAT superfamily N-acetyltransferase
MRLRDYKPSDRSACLALFDSNVPEYFIPAERNSFAEFLNAPGTYYVVETDLKEFVACGGWFLDGNVAGLSWGIVDRRHHRRGYGKFLLEARLNAIRSDGSAKRVCLHTIASVQGFFERAGFKVTQIGTPGVVPEVPLVELVLDLCNMGGTAG